MTNNEIKIRKATEKDYSSVNLLYLETDSLYRKNIPETYKKPPKPTLPQGNFLNMLEDKDSLVIVAVTGQEIAGMLYATIEKDDGDRWVRSLKWVTIEEISVFPKADKEAIGVRLIHEVETWAKKKGIKRVSTLVYDFNKTAISFYSKNGYKPYSTQMNKKIL